MSAPTLLRVAVIAFDGISPFHLSVPCLVFGEDRLHDGSPRFDTRVCAVAPGSLGTGAGFRIDVGDGLDAVGTADIVVVPSWHDDLRSAPPELLDTLRAARERGAVVMGLCLGAFVLAEAGLLDGRPATTHWNLATAFAERHPRVPKYCRRERDACVSENVSTVCIDVRPSVLAAQTPKLPLTEFSSADTSPSASPPPPQPASAAAIRITPASRVRIVVRLSGLRRPRIAQARRACGTCSVSGEAGSATHGRIHPSCFSSALSPGQSMR